MQFNYSKLLGRIKECGYIQETLAKEIGMAKSTLNLKLNNNAFFTQPEMEKISEVLSFPSEEIGAYFFTPKVRKTE